MRVALEFRWSARSGSQLRSRGELAQERVEARDTEVIDEQAAPSEALGLLARAPHGGMAVHAGDHDHDVRALHQSVERSSTAPGLVAAVKIELDPGLGRALPIDLLRPIDSADDANVHRDLL